MYVSFFLNFVFLSEYFPTVSCGFVVIAIIVIVVSLWFFVWGVRALHTTLIVVSFVFLVVSILRGIPL